MVRPYTPRMFENLFFILLGYDKTKIFVKIFPSVCSVNFIYLTLCVSSPKLVSITPITQSTDTECTTSMSMATIFVNNVDNNIAFISTVDSLNCLRNHILKKIHCTTTSEGTSKNESNQV